MACLDTFVITISGLTNASIDIPGSNELTLRKNEQYVVGFNYVAGKPAAHAFGIDWVATLDDGTPSDARPTVFFLPETPGAEGNDIRGGSVRGYVQDVEGITYDATLWIRQV